MLFVYNTYVHIYNYNQQTTVNMVSKDNVKPCKSDGKCCDKWKIKRARGGGMYSNITISIILRIKQNHKFIKKLYKKFNNT